VKFPKGADGKEHTRDEVTRIRKLRKWHVMKKHLPTIFYYDSKSAVLILSYHPRFTTHEKEADAMGKFIQELVRAATRVSVTDIHSDNVHKSVSGDTAIIIDFGY
jgi:pyruvate-formate lyase-activating enzyme